MTKQTWYILSGDKDNTIGTWSAHKATERGIKRIATRLIGKHPGDRYARAYSYLNGTTVIGLGTGEARHCPII